MQAVDNSLPGFVFLHTKLRVFTHQTSCFYTPKAIGKWLFLFKINNLQNGIFRVTLSNTLLTLITPRPTISEAVEN